MSKAYDVIVVGAGVFGAWTALRLRQTGRSVLLLDAHGPGNNRASSGGETRIIRICYGPDELYAVSSLASLERWKDFAARCREPLFVETGMLWLAKTDSDDDYTAQGFEVVSRLNVRAERFTQAELQRRYPQIALDDVAWGFFEPESGALMARRCVQAVVADFVRSGGTYRELAVALPDENGQSMDAIRTLAGDEFAAEQFVFACGPWLPQMFPWAMGQRMFITRQEVFFFGVPAGETRFSPPQLPIWLCHGDACYGFPALDGRGFKVAIDRHGPAFDPESGSRTPSTEAEREARNYVARRFPALADAPVVESRVCQYENTWNGDFVIDRHPQWPNVWICGGGSGHGFKHGPMVGEYTAGLVLGTARPEPRFALASKQTRQQRGIY